MISLTPVTLEGQGVRLEPLEPAHEAAVASDGRWLLARDANMLTVEK